MTQTHSFTEGKILKPLLTFSLPILLALVLQAAYGAVDLWVVGQFATAADVSAVSTASQLMQSVTTVITGLTMGATVMLGQALGQGRREEAGRMVGSVVTLFGMIAAVLTVTMVLCTAPLVTVLSAPQEAFTPTCDYVRWCSWGLIFITAYNVFGGIFRGIGDSKTPLITVAIACAVNVGLDLLLVAVFRMGAAGAAIATVAAQGVSVAASFLLLKKRGLPFPVTRAELRPHGVYVRKTLLLGCPIALQDGLVSVSFLVILAIINGLGLTASAGVGVAEKVCAFIMLVPSSFMQSMSAFVAQNIGAGKPERARKALYCCVAASLCFGMIIGYASFFHGTVLTRFFMSDAVIAAAGADYLKAYAIDCLLTSFLFPFIGYFNGCGKTTFVMAQGIIGAFCVRIPVSFLMSRLTPVSLFQVGLATPCSTLVQITLCGIVFLRMKREDEKRLGAAQ